MTAMQHEPSSLDERMAYTLRFRYDIQSVLFELYKFIRDKSPNLEETPHQQAFELIVGAAFSLWRAIFLIEADRSWPSMSSRLEGFLHKVVTDNAITFQDDKANSAWTVGYYLGSANMRLEKAHEKLLLSKQLGEEARNAGLTLTETWNLSDEHTLMEWRMIFESMCTLFKLLNPDLEFKKLVTFARVKE